MLYIGDEVEVTVRGKIESLRDSGRPQGTKYDVVGKAGEFASGYTTSIKLIKKGINHDRDRKHSQNT